MFNQNYILYTNTYANTRNSLSDRSTFRRKLHVRKTRMADERVPRSKGQRLARLNGSVPFVSGKCRRRGRARFVARAIFVGTEDRRSVWKRVVPDDESIDRRFQRQRCAVSFESGRKNSENPDGHIPRRIVECPSRRRWFRCTNKAHYCTVLRSTFQINIKGCTEIR